MAIAMSIWTEKSVEYDPMRRDERHMKIFLSSRKKGRKEHSI